VADLLFLRLARVGADLVTSGDRGFIPELARSWTRRDSLTLVFDLDPRAHWHDGTPVTARDVLFSFARARDPQIDPQRALLLRNVESVTAEGDRRVVVRFSRVYAEQLYDATWHVTRRPSST
jgi:peptide/nickel transport system substrate-binding protein